MDAIIALLQQCAPAIDTRLSAALVRQESSFNPYAIGLDGNAVLKPQPRSRDEAIKRAKELAAEGREFSVGLAQVHVSNVRRYGLSWEQAFDPCTNLKYGQTILQDFHRSALKAGFKDGQAVFAALRGYNSGDIHGAVSNNYATSILNSISQPIPLPPVGATAPSAPAPVVTAPAVTAAVSRKQKGGYRAPINRGQLEDEPKELFDIEDPKENTLSAQASPVVNQSKELFE